MAVLAWQATPGWSVGVTRLIGPDGKWSVFVKLHRSVCTVSKHILTSMHVYVQCTYKDMNSWTCMYIYIYLCTCTYHHLLPCTYTFMSACNLVNLYIHVCTIFRHICTVLPILVQVVRIPDGIKCFKFIIMMVPTTGDDSEVSCGGGGVAVEVGGQFCNMPDSCSNLEPCHWASGILPTWH